MDEIRLSNLLSQVQRLSEGGRMVSLPELCRDCPELLPELERRLQAFHDVGNFVSKADAPSSTTPSNAKGTNPTGETVDFSAGFEAASSVPAAERPLMLGRYRVERLLGRGGFGEVFEARDQLLQRLVAIKTLRPDRHHDERWSQNLLSEARKLASIEHPNVVRVYDVAEEAGEILIVAAYIDGSDLKHRLQRGRMPLMQGLPIIAGIAEALHHIHLLGLVHRDVKPGNILLDGQNWPYLSDFGVAASEDELLREQPGVLGTYAYMSPEQVRGDSNLVDARTDVYSLGVVLYEILTGRLPFKATNRDEYREQILNRPPRPPRTIDDTIAPELERICLKCLAKSVDDRYTTARDLANDLRAWLDRESPPEPPSMRPSQQPRRPWMGVAVGAGALLCLGLALLLAYGNWQENPQPKPPVVGEQGKKKVKAALEPGVWYDLLDEEPTVLLRPERLAQQFDSVKKELWWDTHGDSMFRLGTVAVDDYEVEASFEQSGLVGTRGFYFGLAPSTPDGPQLAECQSLLVAPDKSRKAKVFSIRTVVNRAAGRVVDLRPMPPFIGLPDMSPIRFALSAQVREGKLSWVRIDHVPVEGLTLNPPAPTPKLSGDFGLYTNLGSGRLLKARWKTLK